jgi:hypothetical protein
LGRNHPARRSRSPLRRAVGMRIVCDDLRTVRRDPGEMARGMGATAPEADRAVIAARTFAQCCGQLVPRRHSTAMSPSSYSSADPLGVELLEIIVPSSLWHGGGRSDRPPVAVAEHVAATVPGCVASIEPSAGTC